MGWIVEAGECLSLPDGWIEPLLKVCGAQTRKRLENRRRDKLRQGLAAHLALEYALFLGAGLAPGEYSIAYDLHGKPSIEETSQLYISKAHSGSLAAAAVGVEPVGIDVQKRFGYRRPLAERLCGQEEMNLLESSLEPERLLTQLFCCKEAYGKLSGRGLAGCRETVFFPEGKGVFLCGEERCVTWWKEPYLLCLCSRESGWQKRSFSACQLTKWRLGIYE